VNNFFKKQKNLKNFLTELVCELHVHVKHFFKIVLTPIELVCSTAHMVNTVPTSMLKNKKGKKEVLIRKLNRSEFYIFQYNFGQLVVIICSDL